jgi:hypothetical protein
MQVVKGDQNVCPVPGGVAGLPSPGGYKYGGLAFQVGVWATGQQPVTVKKPRNRLSGIGLGSGKGYEVREEDSKLECGLVYKQILINAKLQIGRSGQKTEWLGKSIKEAKVRIGL